MSEDDLSRDYALLCDTIRDWARTEARNATEQTRKNLERELAEWKRRYGEASTRIGRLREINRIYRRDARITAQEAVKAFNKKCGDENAPKRDDSVSF